MSQHPADKLIRELTATGRAAEPQEIDAVLRRMVEADFPGIAKHLRQRVDEKQWAKATSEAEYLQDLRQAIVSTGSRLLVYHRRGGSIAAVLSATGDVVPEDRRGDDWLPLLYVVHSADRGILLSGYQASALSRIGVPKDARWLN